MAERWSPNDGWAEMMAAFKRMATDEGYRKEVKRLDPELYAQFVAVVRRPDGSKITD